MKRNALTALVLAIIMLMTGTLNALASVVSAQVEVIYVSADGEVLNTAVEELTSDGTHWIYALSTYVPEGYTLISESNHAEVTVINGKASPSSVTFRYALITPEPTACPVQVGEYVEFGHYPQTAEGNDSTPIEWLVLDVQDGKALLLSRYGLDAKPYNTKQADVTWETCSLRTWLNGEFLNRAFTAKEQGAIVLTTVDNSASQCYSGWSRSGGKNTEDRIFLLSYGEAHHYLGAEHWKVSGAYQNKASRTSPTGYAVSQGAKTSDGNKTAEESASGWWWLRSPGGNQFDAAFVGIIGVLDSSYVNYASGCVRPALWLDLESDIF